MHGNKSNLVLLQNDMTQDLFRKKLTGDNGIVLSSLDREINWSFEQFDANQRHPEKIYFTFGKVVWSYLNEKGFNQKSVAERWNMIQNVVSQLSKKKYFITTINNTTIFSLLEIGDIQKVFTDPVQALNHFFQTFTSTHAFSKEKNNAVSILTNRLNSGLNYLVKTKAKLDQINHDDHYKRWADILMANLHVDNTDKSAIQLADFYNDNQRIDIKLKKDLSLQKNAELYYRKAKNHRLEIEYLEKTISAKEKEIEKLQQTLSELNSTTDLKTLRSQTNTLDLAKKNETIQDLLPYHEFEHQGFRIWVGRNAAANDQLTLKHAYKEDLWLHAKDVAGSHVIIKYQSGKKFPKDVIERAAQLAAYNSKRKNESLCPVIFTPKKFVRKRKGDPAGAVVVEREEVIMVEPGL
jgi:predicted ribosome quality control (RQC) complex YloA/Tae2 family protein